MLLPAPPQTLAEIAAAIVSWTAAAVAYAYRIGLAAAKTEICSQLNEDRIVSAILGFLGLATGDFLVAGIEFAVSTAISELRAIIGC